MSENTGAPEKIHLKYFLEKIPPGSEQQISPIPVRAKSSSYQVHIMPNIEIHCSSEECGGNRIFASASEIQAPSTTNAITRHQEFLHYVCENCKSVEKIYAIFYSSSCELMQTGASLEYVYDVSIVKIGEFPSFGEKTPKVLTKLFDQKESKEMFFKGRQSENQGLAIGAYAYYRRVVELQRDHLIDEVISIAQTVSVPPDVITGLESQKEQWQFEKSIDEINWAIPESFLINGQNPFKLLHSALSEGIHRLSEEECMARASAAREILIDLARKISNAKNDNKALADAVNFLVRKNGS